MKLNKLLKFRTGSKFIVTKDFTSQDLHLWGGTAVKIDNFVYLPKGLVFTIVTVNLNNISQTLRCKIIRSKKIVKEVYEGNGVDQKYYTSYRWSGEIDQDSYVRFSLSGEELIDFLKNVKVKSFNKKYKKITDDYQRK